MKAIKKDNLPVSLFRMLMNTATIYLLLIHFNASQLIWGIVGAIWGVVLIIGIIVFYIQQPVDIFDK